MSAPQFGTFEQAFLAQLRKVRDEPEFSNAPRGFHSRELLGVTYRLTNPRERIIRTPSRRTNIVFNFAEALWYLSGSNSLDMVRFYAPSMSRYSADGRTLRGTAYGPRIFNFGGAGVNQWDSVIRTLRADPDSKRAFIQIFAPEELLSTDNIDVACTVGLQYVIRQGRLHALSFMRANDAYRGTASDVFSFTFLQELLAHQLDLELGSYTHVAGSYHLYQTDEASADRVLADESAVDFDPFPVMPSGDNWNAIYHVADLEQAMRTGRLSVGPREIEQLGLPPYWAQVVALFSLHARLKLNGSIDPDLMGFLDPVYLRLVKNCWEDRYARL
ncbi:MAG: thymidylate synthase [Actinoplanes sp.]|nr:thymidylate synthase [Actinoplanes sp.]